MKSTRRMALAVAMAAMLGAAHAQAEGLKFGVAAEPYPPFTSKDASGKWVGWEVDLMEALCAKIEEKCELVEVAWDGIIPALTSKQIDVIWSSMTITDERRKTIDFSAMYYRTPSLLAGPRDADMDITPEHLKGKIIGVQVATTQERYAQKFFGAGSTIKTYQTQDEVNNDLASGRLDYAQADAAPLDAFLKTDVGKGCCESKGLVPHDAETLGEGTGAGIRKEDTALKAKIDAAIAALASDGTLAKITAKYEGLADQIILPKP